MSRAACLGCFRHKKKCDKNFPCGRCLLSGKECIEREPVVSSRPKGIRYTTHACVACNQSKVRCSANRPCNRCERLGFECHDYPYKKSTSIGQFLSFSPNMTITPYSKGARIPIPDLESIYHNFHEFLGTMSPLDLTDLLTGNEMYFLSCLTCATSVLAVPRRRDFLNRMLNLAVFDSNHPDKAILASNRIEAYLECGNVSDNGMNTNAICRPNLNGHIFDSSMSEQQIVDYYFYHHQFTSFPECTDGVRPGVLIYLFLEDHDVDGSSSILVHLAANTEAELITGYTTEEYNSFQNVITSGFTNFDGFPEALRIYHRDDIHLVVTKGMISCLSPGIEIAYEVRLIHTNGRFVYVRCANLTFIKPNGQVQAVVTAFMPLASI